MEEQPAGVITHYFSKINVAVFQVSAPVKAGDMIHIKGSETDFTQKIQSMQVEHQQVTSAKAGDSVGLKTDLPAKEHDKVYLVK